MFKNLFKKTAPLPQLFTDMHAHFLPGLDDGAKDLGQSIMLIEEFVKLGYKKLIATPHIMQDYYPNTPEAIRGKLREVKEETVRQGLSVELEAAAEYYLDEYLIEKVNKKEELLLLKGKYVLFEMSFMTISPYLNEFIFHMMSMGITPVLAHVERYSYLDNKFTEVEDMVGRGALMQVNINSLSGMYSKPVRKFAEKLVDEGLVHFLGSDCHRLEHLEILKEARKKKYYKKAVHLPLINNTL